MMKAITFGDIRDYCSRIDKISICMKETLAYQNYSRIDEVPHDYDHLYLYGFGVIDSEFEAKNADGRTLLERCLEFMLSEKPREDL